MRKKKKAFFLCRLFVVIARQTDTMCQSLERDDEGGGGTGQGWPARDRLSNSVEAI